ncbi:hypothetical protein D3C71_1810260 [compost metagenome]
MQQVGHDVGCIGEEHQPGCAQRKQKQAARMVLVEDMGGQREQKWHPGQKQIPDQKFVKIVGPLGDDSVHGQRSRRQTGQQQKYLAIIKLLHLCDLLLYTRVIFGYRTYCSEKRHRKSSLEPACRGRMADQC